MLVIHRLGPIRRVLAVCLLVGCLVWFHCGLRVSTVHRDPRKVEEISNWDGVTGPVLPVSSSHPLDNLCQYPVLIPEDDNLKHVIKHIRVHACKKVQLELLSFDYDTGQIIFDQALADRYYSETGVQCRYRPFSGGIRPRITEIVPLTNWTPLVEHRTRVDHDLIETECRTNISTGDDTGPTILFRFAFGRVTKRNSTVGRPSLPYVKSDQGNMSIDVLVLDSTSLNVMKRHMPLSWRYMKEEMGFFHLEGYNKVGDNSMVNLMPILAGLRYGDQAPDMRSEVPTDRPIHAESIPFLWKLFRERGCATLFNDDIADWTRGFMNYPWTHFKGFAHYPTDHFARPWHLYHRRRPLLNSSKFCFGNEPYYTLQLHFLEQMIKTYSDTCHFSFNFITDLSHDDPNNLELADDHLHSLLKRVYTGDYLNNSILIVMGDHGNRIGYVMYSYVGRIEERMSLFSIYFPEWYRRKYPEAMRQLQINKHRLTSNYDIYRTLGEIFNNTLGLSSDQAPPDNTAASKGISLFRPIPTNRTCPRANIPPPHCVCLQPIPTWSTTTKRTDQDALHKLCLDVITNWTRAQLVSADGRCDNVTRVEMVSAQVITTSQMIQHGVRDMSPDQTKRLQKRLDGDIEYVDMVYRMLPTLITARTRLQYYKKPKKKVIINIHPIPSSNAVRKSCRDSRAGPWFCKCSDK